MYVPGRPRIQNATEEDFATAMKALGIDTSEVRLLVWFDKESKPHLVVRPSDELELYPNVQEDDTYRTLGAGESNEEPDSPPYATMALSSCGRCNNKYNRVKTEVTTSDGNREWYCSNC